LELNELNKNAMGGTELMGAALRRNVDHELLDQFQIISSRVRKLDPHKKKIYWLHDLPGDPEVQHLKDGGWKQYDILVFVSHWQQEMYNLYLGVPYDAGVVLRNAITPITKYPHKKRDTLKLIYTSTPHRGLELLIPVFQELKKIYPIELDVYSSFGLYGWPERDEPYKELFKICEKDPQINYFGSQSNDEVRAALSRADIFAYPSIWTETSCLCLIEAMSAGLTCIHSSLGALVETSHGGLTHMYSYQNDKQRHAQLFYNELSRAIEHKLKYDESNDLVRNITNQKYNWITRGKEWTELLTAIK